MIKSKNVSISVYDAGNNVLQIWGISFTLPGSISNSDGKISENKRKNIQKKIKKILEEVDFSDVVE